MFFVLLLQMIFAAQLSYAQSPDIDPPDDYSQELSLTSHRKVASTTQIIVDPKTMIYEYILPTGFKTAMDEKKGEVRLSLTYQEKKMTQDQANALLRKFSAQISEDMKTYQGSTSKKITLKIVDTDPASVRSTVVSAQNLKDRNFYVLDGVEKVYLPQRVSITVPDGNLNGTIDAKADGTSYLFDKGKPLSYTHPGGGGNAIMDPYYCTFGFDAKTGQYYMKRDQDILFRTKSLTDIFRSNTMHAEACIGKSPAKACEIVFEREEHYAKDENFYFYKYLINGHNFRTMAFAHKDDVIDWVAAHAPEMLRDKKCKFPEESVTTRISRQLSNIAKRQAGLSIFCEQSQQEKLENKLKKK